MSSCHIVSILELADPRKNQGKVAVVALVFKLLIPRIDLVQTSTAEVMVVVVLVVPNQAGIRVKMTLPKEKSANDQLYLPTNTGRVWLSSSPLLSRSTSITRMECTICSKTIGPSISSVTLPARTFSAFLVPRTLVMLVSIYYNLFNLFL
jgi:hypothetical protein